MLDKAIDFIRYLGWSILDFIYGLVDTIFDVLNSINTYNIIDTIADNNLFKSFHSGVIIIALTLLGLFSIWKFVIKIIEPDVGNSVGQIVTEIIKCSMLVLLSTFLFAQVSTFSIKLAGYTGSIFSNQNVSLSTNMLSLYVTHSEDYKKSEYFKNEDINKNIKNDNFTKLKQYNEKFLVNDNNENPGENQYKYSINWIMGILVGAFFLYALFFSGMMLARRQIEFLFLFVISPIVFATSIGAKQRRSAVIEQLVSLTLQGAIVMLIIFLTALVMEAIDSTTFFGNSVVKNTLIKSLMFVGCGSFLLTGSGVVNRFVGSNVSANSGREQLMVMGGFGRVISSIAGRGSMATIGASLVGTGLISKAVSSSSASSLEKIGYGINSFGSGVASFGLKNNNSIIGNIGSKISNFGASLENNMNDRRINENQKNKISDFLINSGKDNISSSIRRTRIPSNYYRRK